jgi:hypothetical protein
LSQVINEPSTHPHQQGWQRPKAAQGRLG